MKVALCIDSFEQAKEIIEDKEKTIEVSLIDREICEDPVNRYLQVIPYVTFFAVNQDTGKLVFIQYQRKGKVEEGSEERLAGMTSIGFGGHIDTASDIVSSEVIQKEDGSVSYAMNISDMAQTCFNCAEREIKEEIGIDLADFDIDFNKANTAFFVGDQADEVNQVHLGFSIQVQLPFERFEEFKDKCIFNPEEIEKLDVLGVNMDAILEQLDLTYTIDQITKQLKEQNSLEDWSLRIFTYVLRTLCNSLLGKISYQDLLHIARARIAQEEASKADSQQETFH